MKTLIIFYHIRLPHELALGCKTDNFITATKCGSVEIEFIFLWKKGITTEKFKNFKILKHVNIGKQAGKW